MRVLVTGGAGFIGGNLVAALAARGDTVRVLRRATSDVAALAGLPVEHAVGDLLDSAAVGGAVEGCEAVFHLAAVASYWRASRETTCAVNVEGTRHVMEACLRAGARRVVHTSSTSAIGIPPVGTVGDEETPFDERSGAFTYADSKRLAEAEVQRAVAQGLQAVIVNPATVVGPGDYSLYVGAFLIEFARGRIPAVPPGGMCFVDMQAVVSGHLAALERGRVGQRYILGGENLTYWQVAEAVAELIGRPAPRLTLPRWALGPAARAVDGMNRLRRGPPVLNGEQVRLSAFDLFYDSSKAARELDYPMMPFRAALQKAYDWYRERGYLP